MTVEELAAIVSHHLRAAADEIDRSRSGHPTPPDTSSGERGSWELVADWGPQSYTWPKDNGGVELYDRFLVYRRGTTQVGVGLGAEATVKGVERRMTSLFRVDGMSKRYVVPFVSADDFAKTGEMVALIRGKGPSRRQLFAAGDPLPAEYDHLRIGAYGQRIAGAWNRLCVIAQESDLESMLDHAAAQIAIRDL